MVGSSRAPLPERKYQHIHISNTYTNSIFLYYIYLIFYIELFKYVKDRKNLINRQKVKWQKRYSQHQGHHVAANKMTL